MSDEPVFPPIDYTDPASAPEFKPPPPDLPGPPVKVPEPEAS